MDVLSAFKVAPAALLYAIQPLAYSLLAEYGLDWDGDEDKDFGLTVVALTSTVALLAEGPLVVVILLEGLDLVIAPDPEGLDLVIAPDPEGLDLVIAVLDVVVILFDLDLTKALPLSFLIWLIILSVLSDIVPGFLDLDTALSILANNSLALSCFLSLPCNFKSSSLPLWVIFCLGTCTGFGLSAAFAAFWLPASTAALAWDPVILGTVLLLGWTATLAWVGVTGTLLSSGFTLLLVKLDLVVLVVLVVLLENLLAAACTLGLLVAILPLICCLITARSPPLLAALILPTISFAGFNKPLLVAPRNALPDW